MLASPVSSDITSKMLLFNIRRRTIVAASIACGLHAAVWADDAGFEAAVASFKSRQYANAYGQFVELANRGDADAARFSLFLLKYGPMLYGSHWDATPDEQSHWARLAATPTARQPPTFVPLTPAKSLRSVVKAQLPTVAARSLVAPKSRRSQPDVIQ